MNAELYDALISANAPDDQARKAAVSVASVVGYPSTDEIATKADLQEIKADLQENMATKADLQEMKADLQENMATKAELKEIKAEMVTKTDLKADIATLEARLTWRMLSSSGLTIAAIGVLLAIFK